jgi:hypothetical protein
MSETLTFDPTPSAEVLSSIEADESESLALGEELESGHEALLAGKYQNADELEQAYLELQKKLGSNDESDDEVEYEEEDAPDEEEKDESEDPYVDFLFNVNNEFAENGELSEETWEQFSNFPSARELAESYFRYQQQLEPEAPTAVELSTAEVSQIQNAVGGQEAYQQLTTWAADNFSPQEVEAFDQVVESGNMGAINLALQALYYRYTDAMGYEGELIQGKSPRSMDVFKSQAEVVRAMSDKRYDRDPAYRQEIVDKLGRSDLEF